MRKGLRPGPWYLGEETRSDLPVIAGPEHEDYDYVVVGRFPLTKKYDAYAHALAYRAVPDLIAATKRLIDLVSEQMSLEYALHEASSDGELQEIVNDIRMSQRIREQANALLLGREAIRKAESN